VAVLVEMEEVMGVEAAVVVVVVAAAEVVEYQTCPIKYLSKLSCHFPRHFSIV